MIDMSAFFQRRSRGDDTTVQEEILGAELRAACHETGMFYLVGHNIKFELMDRLMTESAHFFALPDEVKNAISCRNDAHFRGYGCLKNSRDWREQIHIGVEAKARAGADLTAKYWRLEGPNRWPTQRTAEFQNTALEYINGIESLSRILLNILAGALGKPSDLFTSRMKNNPYLLAKFMSYLPQSDLEANSANEERQRERVSNERNVGARVPNERNASAHVPNTTVASKDVPNKTGVTAHCDWSWLTFLQQDDVGGLEAMDIFGKWHGVEPLPHALVVNTGELLEIETGGYLRASPHRVINARIDRQRFSQAVFINPDLEATIYPSGIFSSNEEVERSSNGPVEGFPTAREDKVNQVSQPGGSAVPPGTSSAEKHVHKVIKPGTTLGAFTFGDSEWERKGEGNWCYEKGCLTAY